MKLEIMRKFQYFWPDLINCHCSTTQAFNISFSQVIWLKDWWRNICFATWPCPKIIVRLIISLCLFIGPDTNPISYWFNEVCDHYTSSKVRRRKPKHCFFTECVSCLDISRVRCRWYMSACGLTPSCQIRSGKSRCTRTSLCSSNRKK